METSYRKRVMLCGFHLATVFKAKGPARDRPFRWYKSFAGEAPAPHNYFFGAIASFAALATRNFTTVFALI